MNNRCPDDPLAAGNRIFKRWSKSNDAKVTISGNLVRCKA